MFSAISQVPGLLPRFETRQALIIVNLQNDSLYAKDDMYITKNHDFVDRIKALVPSFRAIGDIVWIKTEMGTKSFPTSPGSAQIEEEVAKADEKNRDERKAEEEQLEDDTVVNHDAEDSTSEHATLEDPPPQDYPYYHPTSRSKAMMKRASAKARADQRTANSDVFNDTNDVFEEHMTKPRKGQQQRFYIGGTLGAELADQLLPVVDESKDLILTKYHYSAFDQTSLLMSLRMRLVTDIYLCGCLTNVGVYATAADAVQHGLGVTLVEDCLGYRSEEKHLDAMRQMADIMGVNGIDSEEIIEEVNGGPAPPDSEEPIFSGPGPEGIVFDRLSLNANSPEPNDLEDVQVTVDPIYKDDEAQNGIVLELEDAAKAKGEPQPLPAILGSTSQPSGDVLPTVEIPENQATETLKSASDGFTPLPSPNLPSGKKRESWQFITTNSLGPGDGIGTGDSRIIYDVLSPTLIDGAFQLLREEVGWQTMLHRSGKVPRLVAVQGEIANDGSVPIYRHPADESPKLVSFSCTVQKIRQEVETALDQSFNHALIQLYRDGNDYISEHSDKTLDIARGSNIVNVSIGAQRTMTLRSKKSMSGQGTESASTVRQSQRIPMPHNSAFILGPQTNMRWLHGVRADKRPQHQRLNEEQSFGGERISITFRQIGSFIDLSTQTIWGQGAKQKEKANAGKISTDDDAEMEAMIMAFGKENHQSDFDWEKKYGQGFDVINLACEKCKLILCDDKVANLRVRLSLSEKRVQYLLADRIAASHEESRANRYKLHPWNHGLSNTQKPIFRDVDEDNSETEGDLAILFYLEKFYPFSIPEGLPPREVRRATALIFTRASKSNELLFWWREMQAMDLSSFPSTQQQVDTVRPVTPNLSLLEEFNKDLDMWESYAAEADYIVGDFWTIIDCAFWPVLDEIISGWEDFDHKRYPKLLAYYQRVLNRPCVQKLLEAGI